MRKQFRIVETDCNKITIICPLGHEVEITYPHAPKDFPQAFPCSCGEWKSVWAQFYYEKPGCPYCKKAPSIEAGYEVE
jgi:hypothetical protein